MPHEDFIQGKTVERLKDGASVAFIGQLTISTSPSARAPAARSIARFALSYDIWEERFSVTRFGQTPGQAAAPRRTVSHLSAAAAEAWCIDSLTIDRDLIPPDQAFYTCKLDLRAEDPKEQFGSVFGDPGINITRLIEIFGRPGRGSRPRWLLGSGPHRLVDLKKSGSSGCSRVTLRTRLALVFIAATLAPLGAMVWVTTVLLDHSLRLSSTDQISQLSRSLEKTGREYYQQACERLKADALAGRVAAIPAPEQVSEFLAGHEQEQFVLTGDGGSTLLYLTRTPGPNGAMAYARPLGIRMSDLSRQYSEARQKVNVLSQLRQGFFATWGFLAAAIWLAALALVWLVATRFSRPIARLTEGMQGAWLRAIFVSAFPANAPMKLASPPKPSTAPRSNWSRTATAWFT